MVWLNRAVQCLSFLRCLPKILLALVRSKLRGDGDGDVVLRWLMSVNSLPSGSHANAELLPAPTPGSMRLYSWELSYFSGKIRGYLRFKARHENGPRWSDVVATPDIIATQLFPASQSSAVPQLQFADGTIIQDSSSIMDAVEVRWPTPPVLPGASAIRQRLVCQLLELLGDEWLLVAAYHWRWSYSGEAGNAAQRMHTHMQGVTPVPNHREHNILQWGAFMRPAAPRTVQERTGRYLIDTILLSDVGVKGALKDLGVTADTVAAWEASCRALLRAFDAHLAVHPFVLGGRPSTADFGLLGPLYAHLYRDPVPGAMMRAEYPRVHMWCKRMHERGGETATRPHAHTGPSSGGSVGEAWLGEDTVPPTVLPLLEIFAAEMWPVLKVSLPPLPRTAGPVLRLFSGAARLCSPCRPPPAEHVQQGARLPRRPEGRAATGEELQR